MRPIPKPRTMPVTLLRTIPTPKLVTMQNTSPKTRSLFKIATNPKTVPNTRPKITPRTKARLGQPTTIMPIQRTMPKTRPKTKYIKIKIKRYLHVPYFKVNRYAAIAAKIGIGMMSIYGRGMPNGKVHMIFCARWISVIMGTDPAMRYHIPQNTEIAIVEISGQRHKSNFILSFTTILRQR